MSTGQPPLKAAPMVGFTARELRDTLRSLKRDGDVIPPKGLDPVSWLVIIATVVQAIAAVWPILAPFLKRILDRLKDKLRLRGVAMPPGVDD